ncbi:RraA family protein [Alteromonas sp. CYL-A6]|uniref:RraA family protein n=1 Tax=Alteromonas nitratireducens TaxID=3390813 RepID=UPI0034AB5548
MNEGFCAVSTCDYADALGREQFMDFGISGVWRAVPRIAGPAYTVKCEAGDHLMLHAAIYRASPGDIIVVEADSTYALAGGNVCAIAQRRGIKGFVLDGTLRDVGEVRDMQFPVYARGHIPKPGAKKRLSPLNEPITCGGVTVNPGDIIVADEEGIAVLPKDFADEALRIAKARAEKDASMTLDEWEADHKAKVDAALAKLGWQA